MTPEPTAEPREVDAEISGSAEGVFAPVADLFARLIAAQGGLGAAVAIYHRGEPVVDLHGGSYEADSMQVQYSVSKLAAAIACAHARQSGRLDLDAPLADFWPAFDRDDTRAITTQLILGHRAGLPGVEIPLTVEQVLAGAYSDALEHQRPYWEPGARHGYHSFSYGPLLDGVFRRTLGMTVGEYAEAEIARPLELDLWFGSPPAQRHRVVPYRREIIATTPLTRSLPERRAFADRGSEAFNDFTVFNTDEVIAAGWPNANVVCTARSMARLIAATMSEVDGRRVLSPDSLDRMIKPTGSGIDWVHQFPIAYGSGVQLPYLTQPMGGPGSFGHGGAGGCIAYGDPAHEISVAFTTCAYPAMDGASPLAATMIAGLNLLLAENPGA